MPIRVNINGAITAADDARIPVLDHGFLFGDNVYEAIRTYDRKPFLFSRHYARLQHSANAIFLTVPRSRQEMLQEIRRTLADAAIDGECRIRLIVTRGVGDLSPFDKTCSDPSTIIIVSPLQPLPAAVYSHGAAVVISRYTRGGSFSDVKTGNLIQQVLAYREVRAADVHEAILTTPEGYLSDGITSNVYMVRAGTILTPSREANALEGITRGVVLELARGMGVNVVEGLFRPEQIAVADEMFLTSTTREVVPIVRVNGEAVANGRPGPLTLSLLEAYRSAIQRLLKEDVA
jgi:branched-chain amino acid aminotransferase